MNFTSGCNRLQARHELFSGMWVCTALPTGKSLRRDARRSARTLLDEVLPCCLCKGLNLSLIYKKKNM